MSITAFVPARSGSTRLPHKNIKLLNGKPLVVWTLEACIRADQVSKVIFSTDSEEYWNTVQQYIQSDKLQVAWRTPDEAGNKVKIFDYMQQQVDQIFSPQDDYFLLALPTMPFRDANDINAAIALMQQKNKPVFSAVEFDAPMAFGFTVEGDNWQPVLANSPMITGNTRSQDQFTAYHPNGAIYLRKTADLRQPTLKTFYQGAVPYLMDRSKSVDIDTQEDFFIAEAIGSVLREKAREKAHEKTTPSTSSVAKAS